MGREEEFPMSSKMCRVLTVVAVVSLSTVGAAQASGRRVASTETSFFAATWEWIAGWFRSVPGGWSVIWSEAGPEMDPNGGPHTGSPVAPNAPTSDEGSSMDPNGR